MESEGEPIAQLPDQQSAWPPIPTISPRPLLPVPAEA